MYNTVHSLICDGNFMLASADARRRHRCHIGMKVGQALGPDVCSDACALVVDIGQRDAMLVYVAEKLVRESIDGGDAG